MNHASAVILSKHNSKGKTAKVSVVALLVNKISKALNSEHRLIDQQICVYLSWQERHKGWRLHGEEEWIQKFVQHSQIEDVSDITSEVIDSFLLTLRGESDSDYLYRHAKTAIYRFMRFYQARTKGFTSRPRSVVFK